MTISAQELWALSYYRASELAGALLFGRLARRVTDPELLHYLTLHFAEEARHAAMWTETIQRCGAVPLQIATTYQSLYGSRIGLPASMAEVLLLTEVFEERIYRHFTLHAARSDVHPIVREALEKMLEDEREHVGWISQRLERHDAAGEIRLEDARRRCREIDAEIYDEVRANESTLRDFLGERGVRRREIGDRRSEIGGGIEQPAAQSPISDPQSPTSDTPTPISGLQSPISHPHSPISGHHSPISDPRSPRDKGTK